MAFTQKVMILLKHIHFMNDDQQVDGALNGQEERGNLLKYADLRRKMSLKIFELCLKIAVWSVIWRVHADQVKVEFFTLN